MNYQNAAGMSAGLRRTLIALVTVVAVVLAAAFGLKQVPVANAAPVDVTISNVKVTKQGGGQQIVKGNEVDVRMDWAANGPFGAGDTFEVDFPDTFKPQSNTSFNLTDEKGVVGGNCSVAAGAQSLTCTLNGEFSGKENVKGVIGLRAQAEKANTETKYPFTVTGKQSHTVNVDVPGGVKEQGTIDTYNPVDKLEKSAHIASLSDEYLIWDVLIPYDSFKDADQIIIKDTIKGTNHKHVDAIDPETGDARSGATQRDRKNERQPLDVNFEIVNESAELAVTIKPLTGAGHDGKWKEGQDIHLTYWTQRTNEVTEEGDTYSNEVEVTANGATSSAQAQAFWNTEGFGTIEGVNTGSFSLTKTVEVEGGGTCEALKDASFPVNVKITLPEGFEDKEYPNSEARGERSGNVITYTDTVKDGATIRGYDKLPAGTTVEFSETQPKIAGVTFKEPKFSAEKITIEDENSSNVAVTLTNPATCTPPSTTGESTPPTSGESTPPSSGEDTPDTPGSSGGEKNLWWLLLIPAIPALVWLFKGASGSSNPTPPVPGVPGDNPKPGQPGDKTEPKQPGEPSKGQPAEPTNPSKAGKPTGDRQQIKSVPSGATTKGDGVADFIG